MPRFWLQSLRSAQLFIGLFFCGTALAIQVWASVGVAPWDVLGQGFMKITGLSFGVSTVIISIIVMLFWIPLRERPGIGTVANALGLGFVADFWLALLPAQTLPELPRYAIMLFGIILMAIGSGLYIGAQLGSGARDGLMTGMHRKFGWPIWRVRTGIELTVLCLGWALGGQVGFGTIIFSVLIGPLCQIFIKIFSFPAYARTKKNSSATPTPAENSFSTVSE